MPAPDSAAMRFSMASVDMVLYGRHACQLAVPRTWLRHTTWSCCCRSPEVSCFHPRERTQSGDDDLLCIELSSPGIDLYQTSFRQTLLRKLCQQGPLASNTIKNDTEISSALHASRCEPTEKMQHCEVQLFMCTAALGRCT